MSMLTESGTRTPVGAPPIKEATAESFTVDVLEASREVPVVVDFWAPWCGPCRQLTPVIEKVVREAAGRVRLVKVNIDENPVIASQLGVRSIPAVFAFSNGRPVDGFLGALPESQVRHFIERLAGAASPGAQELLDEAAEALAAGDVAGAVEVYGEVLSSDPRNTKAIAGLARAHMEAKDFMRAEEALALAPPDRTGDADIASARAALELSRDADRVLANLAPLEARVAVDPTDHQARIDYAVALNAAGNHEAALDQLIESIRRNKEWNDAAARKQLLMLFEAWGATDPLTVAGRRKLSSVLFS